jgi:hypothetical protein
MQEITFGYGYDNPKVGQQKSSSGYSIVGPLGLVNLLETQLGLASIDTSFTTRLVQYHKCLKQILTPTRFYYRSFMENEFASTRTLLQWRDELYLGGWNGKFELGASARLMDIVDAEVFAKPTVDLNTGQRITRIIAALQSNKIQVSKLTISDDRSLLPPIVDLLFNALEPHCEIVISPDDDSFEAAKDSDLYLLQQSLLKPVNGTKTRLKGDGSFVVLEACSKSVSSSYIAHLICENHSTYNSSTQYAILAEHESEYLDTAFEQLGGARQNQSDNSPWRPAFQVLPLCFEILWVPLNPFALFEFLSLSVGPIPARLRTKLADCVANAPGMGGDNWTETINAQLNSFKDQDEMLAERSAKGVVDWLPDQLFCPNEGMPVDFAIKRVQKLGDWLIGKQLLFKGKPEELLYTAALNQALELTRALIDIKSTGTQTIDRESIRDLIIEVRGSGIPIVDKIAEVHTNLPDIQMTNNPAAFISSKDTVIWWGCENYQSPKRWHWTTKERLALAQSSVKIWSTENKLKLAAKQWLKPILSAKEQLIIVLHPNSAQHHPIIDHIAGLCEGWPVIECEKHILSNAKIPLANNASNTENITQDVTIQPLPSASRWWQLPKSISLPNRETESFSSLDQFIYSPYQWLLNYHAKLQTSNAAEVSDGNRLKGSIAHKLLEDYMNEFPGLRSQPKTIKTWAYSRLDTLLAEEGAVLLMPGRQSEMLVFKEKVTFALERLIEHLTSANIQTVEMETHQQSHFVGGNLTGYIDLLAKNADGKEVVLDIKWGGYTYRKGSLEDDRYLQLAIYAAMRREVTGDWPAMAYFIIEDARLVCNTPDFFPNATLAEPKSQESVSEFWQRFIVTWKWRRKQIEQGLVEVTTSNTDPTENSLPPENGLSIPESSDRYNDFTVLTGWEE